MVLVCREKDFCIDIFFEVRLKNVFVSFIVISYLYEIKVFVEKYENSVILLEWGVEFVCNSLVDFNFILKYLRFIEFVQKENCSIRYSLSDMMKVQECSIIVNIISCCNMIGLWVKYDFGIDWVCLNYYQYFGFFENIFC